MRFPQYDDGVNVEMGLLGRRRSQAAGETCQIQSVLVVSRATSLRELPRPRSHDVARKSGTCLMRAHAGAPTLLVPREVITNRVSWGEGDGDARDD